MTILSDPPIVANRSANGMARRRSGKVRFGWLPVSRERSNDPLPTNPSLHRPAMTAMT